jgi:hypothetical protein
MRIEHEFPSDGEYVITVNPILSDNMSPTPFGSVPCEKVEILLDGELHRQVDWTGVLTASMDFDRKELYSTYTPGSL